MSSLWTDRVWRLSTLKGAPLLLALALADNADDAGLCYPGRAFLAQKIRMTDRHVKTLARAIEAAGEVAIERRGHGPRDPNNYIMLVGRVPAEVDRIRELLAAGATAEAILADLCKGEKFTPKHGGNIQQRSGPRGNKKAQKGEAARSPDPLIDRSIDGWLNRFLIKLPGYNSAFISRDVPTIAKHNYTPAALEALWGDVITETGPANRIGLFLYRAGQGIQSSTFVDPEAPAAEADQGWAKIAARTQPAPAAEQSAGEPEAPAAEQSAGEPEAPAAAVALVQKWQAFKGEISLQVSQQLYQRMIEPSKVAGVIMAANGSQVWRIVLPSTPVRDWWSARMGTTTRRILTGIVGSPCDVEFLTVGAN